jgi:hypothetical protein
MSNDTSNWGVRMWSEADFDQMNWSTAQIHAFAALAASSELVLDIDYPVRWVKPVPPAVDSACWVAPVTLVFENVRFVEFHLKANIIRFSIEQVRQFRPMGAAAGASYLWILELFEREDPFGCGALRFYASGYKQYVRRLPVLADSPMLDDQERGGISFSRTMPQSDAQPRG